MDINKHPLLKQCYDLSLQIEKMGSSAELTALSGSVEVLAQSIDKLLSVPVDELGDRLAHVCKCGSVKFNILRSGKLMCYGCTASMKDKRWVPING